MMETRNSKHGNLASGSVKIAGHDVSFIIEGHGRCVAGQIISKVVPGRGRVTMKVTASGGLVEVK